MTATIRCANDQDASQVQAVYEPIVAETAISFELQPPYRFQAGRLARCGVVAVVTSAVRESSRAAAYLRRTPCDDRLGRYFRGRRRPHTRLTLHPSLKDNDTTVPVVCGLHRSRRFP